MTLGRRYPVGAEVGPEGTHVRVWAAGHKRVEARYGDRLASRRALDVETDGYFSALLPDLAAGGRYAFKLDDDEKLYPDPASRYQPEGPHEPSEVVDPKTFKWSDNGWTGCDGRGQVIYEMHVGTFTPEGTWAAAAERLGKLRELGITMIEMMPVADFPGRFGWGYDGVDLWAPTRLYGKPDDLRRFIDVAHRAGMGVILDVVYNHIGPSGAYLGAFSKSYFTDRYPNEWGSALNFDGPDAKPSREFFIENGAYWIEEFHFDGLRLDATHQIFDASADHILAALCRRTRAAADGRRIYIVAENEAQQTKLVRSQERGGFGLDAIWNDDFHHSARVALTGHNEAYYTDYLGQAQELISALRWGFLYQGQWYGWQKQRRGSPSLDLEAHRFVLFLENHDQVSNSGLGERLAATVAPAELRAMTALWLLAPATPMFFQGQEWGSTRPFLYFADHEPELGKLVEEGRRKFLAQFPSLATPEAQSRVPNPCAIETFESCKLDWSELDRNAEWWRLHRDLLTLRREDPVFRQQRADRMHGTVLSPCSLALRFFGADEDRLLVVNLDRDRKLDPAFDPLLAPPAGKRWAVRWSSEAPEYGGTGTPPPEGDDGWHLYGRSAVVLAPADPLPAEKSSKTAASSGGNTERN
jgi:maltooligosyltrehalose trehalohydrolase